MTIDGCERRGEATSRDGAPRVVANDKDVARAAAVFKALGDSARLRLFDAIVAAAPGEICVCDLPDLELSQATISHHLRKLRDAGLVTSERRSTWVYYRSVPGSLDPVRELLGVESSRVAARTTLARS